jgi:hypothetical protein
MKHLCRAVAISTMVFLGASGASAQDTCLLYQRGTVECPGYGAPAATAVPGPSMATTMALGVPQAITLFNGATPPNGFMVRVVAESSDGSSGYGYPNKTLCFINDSGTAASGVGFYLTPDPNGYSATFTTPVGYKPIGPVSIWCGVRNATASLAARGW